MFAEQLLLTLPPLLPEQEPLQPPVPTVLGPVDYRTWRQRLERIDEILHRSRVEEVFVGCGYNAGCRGPSRCATATVCCCNAWRPRRCAPRLRAR